MPTSRAGRREWIGLAVLALPTFVVAIDLFVLLLALPGLSAGLGADGVGQLWITDIYGFLLAGFTLAMGTLGDRIGRRRLLMIGAVTFAAASLLCAYATSVPMLIAARALLGIAGAAIGPATLGLIGGLFTDPGERARAFGVWGGVYTLGALFGPVIGGVLLARYWWGSVFLLGPPVMAVAVLIGLRVLPADRASRAGGWPDPVSVALSLLAVLPLVYAIKELTAPGAGLSPVVALAGGLLAGALFLRRQRRSADPMLDLDLFRNRVIGASLAGQLAFAGFGAGFNLILVLYFQLVAGLSAPQTGLAMVPGMITAAIGFQVAPRLAARFRPGTVIASGLALEAVVLLALTRVDGSYGATALIVAFALTAVGTAAVGLGTGLVVGAAPPEKMGAAGSVAQIANEFGGMLGIALYGTLAGVVYRHLVAVPPGLPPGAAARATDSLAGAAATAGTLPPAQAEALLAAARDAFTGGVHAVAATGAVVFLAVALLVSRGLRNVPPFS